MHYLLLVLIYTLMLWGVYLLLLRNHTQHRLCRIYLLSTAALPLVLPVVQLPALSHEFANNNIMSAVILPDVAINGSGYTAHTQLSYWMIGYAAVAIVLITRLAFRYAGMIRRIKGNNKQVIDGTAVYINTKIGPGSINGLVFFPEAEIDNLILKHEMAHLQLKHTRDMLFMKLLQCICWPNLLLRLICRELKTVHEFEADALVVQNRDKLLYAETLLNEAFGSKQFSIAHNFFHHPLKRRLFMLQKENTTRTKRIRTIAGVAIISFSLIGTVVWAQNAKKPVAKQQQPTSKCFEFVDKMPEFHFGMMDLATYLQNNVHYPEEAQKKRISGRVLVRFIVTENGAVTNAQVMKSVSKELDAEALRVVSNMPKWIPGEQKGKKVSVYFNLPIVFQLEDKKTKG